MQSFIIDVSEKGIPLMVVLSPKYGTISSFDFQPIKDVCYEYNVPIVDYYSDEVLMTNMNFFKEPMHLNDEGARLFTTKLVSKVKLYVQS